MTPLMAALLGGAAYAADPMVTPDQPPRYLDSGQFAALILAAALVVVLLGIIAVGQWRRR